MKRNWRLLISPPSTGAFNMALDEVLLLNSAREETPPTLRLYSWAPPTLSLGYAQSIQDVDQDALTRFGWDLVRRPTGGRAILHVDELTYSITASLDDPVSRGSLLDSYQRISQALLLALSLLGIKSDAKKLYQASNQSKKEPVCFEVLSNFEITVNGKKLIGSAQARKNGGMLQHGSLPLSGDLARITKVLKYPDEERRQAARVRLLDHAGTVFSLTGKKITIPMARVAFINAFSQELNVVFDEDSISKDEIFQVSELEYQKYKTFQWNSRL